MLDSITKKRIDDLRNILVGKIPTPQSQVEQITTALIYKFMDDMDQHAVAMSGVPSFFVGDYEQYAWKHLFNPRLSGADKVKLYSSAIENIYTHPTAPDLFREIFKNSFLPFKDPQTLTMFLKEINEFDYSHSEKLGDAFEYLLSFMGSQGDAGQFRTPRHIIDFMVAITNPQKHETILDPACGTAGFLISSFKHILDQNTHKQPGDKLTAAEKNSLGKNLVGYDISPEMTRLSLVNMYLHQFKNPQIHEYDTLSSEVRWNEYYDVILANPPFFSPTGGIKPHSRFGLQSKRAEVLFVDYIMEHLKPDGRAAIVVPEGIIFQTGTAYKTLRKKLVEDCLVGVISLPGGVFQPYSGVKTSILILDKKSNQKSENIFFAKVENDGFSLGAQRTPIADNDLPEILPLIEAFLTRQTVSDGKLFKIVKKARISEKEFVLRLSLYESKLTLQSNFPKKRLPEVAELLRGTSITKKQVEAGQIPVIAGGQKPAYFHNQANRDAESITVSSSGAYAGFVSFHNKPIFASDCFTIISTSNNLHQRFLFYLLKSKQDLIYQMQTGGGQPHVYAKDFEDFEIPLPPMEEQQALVEELDGYQKIIDGCKQVIQNHKPTIPIDPSWEMVELGELVTFKRGPFGGSLKKEIFVEEGYLVYEQYHAINDDYSKNRYFITPQKYEEMRSFAVKAGDLIVSCSGTMGKISIIPNDHKEGIINQALLKLTVKEVVSNIFLKYYLESSTVQSRYFIDQNGSAIQNVGSVGFLKTIPFPKISIKRQKKIVEQILTEKNLIDGNKKLIDIQTRKIQERIARVWGI